VKQRILRPSVVELPGVERNRLEARVVHADQLVEPRGTAELPVALVLRLAEVHAGDAAAEAPREPPRRAAVAGSGIDDPALATEAPQTASHRRNRTLLRDVYRLVPGFVETDMDILAAPDVVVEIVGVVAVVVIACRLHDCRVPRAHDDSSSVLRYFFSAT